MNETQEAHPIMGRPTPRFDAHILAYAHLPDDEKLRHLMRFAEHMEQCHENQVSIVEAQAAQLEALRQAIEKLRDSLEVGKDSVETWDWCHRELAKLQPSTSG